MGIGQSPGADAVKHGIPIVQLRISGTLDGPSLPKIEHAVKEVLAVNPQVLVIDVSDCAHIDTAGINLLLDVHRRMRRNGGWLTVHAPTSRAQRLLHTARVDHILDIRATDAEPVGATHQPTVASRLDRCAAVPVTTAMNQGGLP